LTDTAPESSPSSESKPLRDSEITLLRQEVERLNSHRFIRLHNSVFQLVLFQFLRGLAFGLGTIFGATVVVSVIVYSLTSIDFIPVIGDWASQVVDIITERNSAE